jgi:iron complex outermembrane recepter protein
MPPKRIAILVCIAGSLLGQSTTAPAQPPALPVVKESVVVTGTYEAIPLEEADRSVISLPARSQNLVLNSFTDLLKLDPSLDLRQRAPNGIQGDLSVRGSTFGQTLVLVNGQRMNDPQSGHHNLDLAVPSQNIESIEILRGAGSTIYGSDALGGVVNVRTAPPESWEVRLRGAIGNYGTNQEAISLSGVTGTLAEQLTVARDFSSGFIPDRDYRSLIVASATSYTSAIGTTGVDLGYSDKPFGAALFYGNYPSWERTKAWFVGARQSLGERTTVDLAYRRHTDLFYLFRDNPQRYQNHHAAETWQASVRRREPLRENMTLFYGVEGLGDGIRSSNLGVHTRARGAAYVSLDIRALKRFSFSAGVRDEVFRGLPGVVSPSFSAGYWASGKLKFRGGVSRAFRVPTFTDLYYKDPANQGNPALLPENAWSYEAGADYRPTGAWRLQATVFQRRDTNVIDYASFSPLGPWVARNIQNLNFTGAEASTAYSWRRQMFEWSYTGLRGVSLALPGIYTKYSFNYPIHAGVFSWSGQLPAGLIARTRVGALERRARDPYCLWDLYLARGVGKFRPFVQLTNLSGTRYQEVYLVPMPGRAILGGVEVLIR